MDRLFLRFVMRKHRILGHMFFLMATVLLVAGLYSVRVTAKKAMPKTVVLKSKMMGDVTFNHKAHIKRAGGKCITCHHKMKTNPKKMACRACHTKKTEGNKPSFKNAFHKTCKGCHKKMHGPTSCKGCHKRK